MYHRVYSFCLEPGKNWYAYNYFFPGANASCKNKGVKHVLNNFPDAVKWVKIADLYNCEGNPASFRWFNAGTTKHSEAFVISSFGILVLALRQHTNNNVWKESEVLQRIRATVNLLTLERDCANTVSAHPVSNKDFARMEMYTKTLQNKLDEQSKVIEGLKIAAQKREYAEQKNAVPAQLKTPRSAESTNNIIESNDLSPPEKKRRLKHKGETITAALKDVAFAHNEDLFNALGNLASEDDKSEAADIISVTTKTVFSRLGAMKAFDVIVPADCQDALVKTIRLPDWRYLLLKLKIRISDQAWQMLLNLTQLGRSMVS